MRRGNDAVRLPVSIVSCTGRCWTNMSACGHRVHRGSPDAPGFLPSRPARDSRVADKACCHARSPPRRYHASDGERSRHASVEILRVARGKSRASSSRCLHSTFSSCSAHICPCFRIPDLWASRPYGGIGCPLTGYAVMLSSPSDFRGQMVIDFQTF